MNIAEERATEGHPRARSVGLRLVHNVGAITEESSGPSYSVVRLCETLATAGHDVCLLALDWAPNPNCPPIAKTFPLGRGPRRLGRSPTMHRWLDREARVGNVDIIHTHGMWLMINVYPGWVARRNKIPLVVSPRGTFTRYALASGSRIKKAFWPLIQRPALAPAVCFHATAEAEYEDIRRMGFRQPVAVIPNGIDLPALRSKEAGEGRTLLFLGRIHPNKGLDMLLPAWARVQDRFPDWRLRIVGSDRGYHGVSGHLEEMKRLARNLGLQRVAFDGPLYGDEKRRAFRNADLYVLPTYSENFGVTVAEALSEETPAIVTEGAPWQGLKANDAGWWIKIGVEPLVRGLEVAMSRSTERLVDMGRRGRQWMQQEFSWHGAGAQMAETYGWLCGRSPTMPSCVRV